MLKRYGPSALHSLLALLFMWSPALILAAFFDDRIVLIGCAGISWLWFGRELEQLWPHIGAKPLPPETSWADTQRFIRQGCWPVFACYGSAITWLWIFTP